MGGAPLLGGAPDAGTPGTQLYSSPASSQLAGYAGGYTSPEGSRVGAVMTVPQAMALEDEAKRIEKARVDKMTEMDRQAESWQDILKLPQVQQWGGRAVDIAGMGQQGSRGVPWWMDPSMVGG